MTKYYLVAYSDMTDHIPIGGLDDVVGQSEFSQDLVDYLDDSSFDFDGHIFFIKDDGLFIHSVCRDAVWEIYDEPIKLEAHHKIMTLG